MGRRKLGPRRLKPDGPYYAVLHVLPKDRAVVGKVRLIRSLKTTDHTEALKRYGVVLKQLEQELGELLSPSTLRARVDARRGDTELSYAELAEDIVGELKHDDPVHEAVYQSLAKNKPLPISWDEALVLWEKVSNRNRTRPIVEGTIYKYKQAVEHFKPYCEHPNLITKDAIRRFLEDYEEAYGPTTVAARYRYLRALFQVLVEQDKVDVSNVFDACKYTAKVSFEDQRRPFTDEELLIIHQHHPEIFLLCVTGLRPGEYFSRLPKDLDGQILRIDDQKLPKEVWRPKTFSSYRNAAVPDYFELTKRDTLVQSNITRIGVDLRKHITDKSATPHSGRHTFYSLARRADVDLSVLTALTGHAQKESSRTAQSYGLFSDEVLIREASKVWELVQTIIR